MGKKRPKPQTIYRVACRHKPYAQLGNAMIRDNRLSFEARGVLAYILSFPSNWQFGQEWLCKKTGLGRDRAYRIIKELTAHGYCQRQQRRRPDGTLGPYEYVFTDEPEAFEPSESCTRSDPDTGPQDVVGVENGTAAEAQDRAPPLPEKPEAVQPLPGLPLPAEPDPANQEAVQYIKNRSYKDPPKVPQQAGGLSPTGRLPVSRPRATYLPPDWTLPDADRAWALTHAPQIAQRLDEEAEFFRDWHAGKRRADWSARWRTWVRRAVKEMGRGRSGETAGRRRAEPPAALIHRPGFGGVRDTSEPWPDYVARLQREGKLPAEVRP